MTAASRDDDPLYFRTAAKTFLAFATVHFVMLLIIARNAACVNEIGNGGAAQFDGLQQNFAKLLAQRLQIGRR